MNRALLGTLVTLFAAYGLVASWRLKQLEERLVDVERRAQERITALEKRHHGEVVTLRGDLQALRKEVFRLRSPRGEPLAMR